MTRAGIADGSMREGADVRLTMLAVLGMMNSVINWRAADQDANLARIAAELSQLVVAGLGKPVPTRKRS